MFEERLPMYIAARLGCKQDGRTRLIWQPLPATKEEFSETLEAIGATSDESSDVFITEYNVRVPSLYSRLLVNTHLGELNFLASRLQGLGYDQVLKLCAIVDSERYFTTVAQVLDYTFTHESYKLLTTVKDEDTLGWHYLYCGGFPEVPEVLKSCVDTLSRGENIARMQDGQFTAMGYLTSDNHWGRSPVPRIIPAEQDLRGPKGERLYGIWSRD